MNLRKRLTLYSSVIFGVVFLVCALIIFFAFYKSTKNSIYQQLKNDALLTAFYYLEQDELPWQEHWLIGKEFEKNIKKNKIAIFDNQDQIVYGNHLQDKDLTNEVLQEIRQKKQYNFKTKDQFYNGIFYIDNQGDFVVVSTESTTEFYKAMNNLLTILFFVFLAGIISIYLLSRHLSNIAYKPLKKIVNQVNAIDYHSMDQQVELPNTKDELDVLIQSYNALLQRLSHSVVNQKNFINYASHEFKTPLTAISGNLQVFGQEPRSPQQYQQMSQKVLQQVYHIESILNNLLVLSNLKSESQQNKDFRLDEVLWNIFDKILQQHQFQITVNIQVQHPDDLIIYANQTLIELALYNLVENAVKYGLNKPVELILTLDNKDLVLKIVDKGKGISNDEIPLLNQIFFRGQQVSDIPGSGIGLNLVASIFELYHIEFQIHSTLNKGTQVTVLF